MLLFSIPALALQEQQSSCPDAGRNQFKSRSAGVRALLLFALATC